MDKAYSRIINLEEALQELLNKNSQNTQEIVKIIKENCILEEKIEILEDSNEKLNNQIICFKENPKKRKNSKKDFVISILIAYIVGTIVALIPICVGNGNFNLVWPCIGTSTLITSFVSSIIVPIQFKAINKKYPLGDVEKLENNILENNEKIEVLSNQKQVFDTNVTCLQEKRKELESKMHEIEVELECTKSLRLKVILDYCKNNPEIDAKIDENYEKSSIQKTKIK